MEVDSRLESLILQLFDIEGVKFGDFKLKSGIQSPAYFDLRVIVSYPKLLRDVSQTLWEAAKRAEKFDSICGVPYTALPIASVMSVDNNIPMLIRRREAKDYGTKKMIEGKYNKGDRCLVVEDVVTSGSSVFETVELLKEYGLEVKDAVVLLEREQGGTERLKKDGVTLHSVLTMSQLVGVLKKHGKIEESMCTRVLEFIAENRFDWPSTSTVGSGDLPKKKEMTYRERATLARNPLGKQLLEIMEEKQSNLAVSVDFTTSSEILHLVEQVGSKVCMVKTHADIIEDFSNTFVQKLQELADKHNFLKSLVEQVGSKVCMVKTHADIIEDFSNTFVQKLQELADKHNFLIFEDRKFADIGKTVLHQYKDGIHKIVDWAHIVNAHTVPGPGVVKGLKKVGMEKKRGCLLIAEMSSAGALAKGDYTKATVDMAKDHDDFVIGFICRNKVTDDPKFIHMTPGVKLKTGTDSLGQQYIKPHDAIVVNKSDLIIVGRGITTASDPRAEAERFRKAGFDAYLERLA